MASAIGTAGVLSQFDRISSVMAKTKEDPSKLDDYEEMLARLLTAGKLMEGRGKTEEVKKLRAALDKAQGHYLEQHRTEVAAKKFKASYAPGPTVTDFAGELAKLRGQTTAQEEKDIKEGFEKDLRQFDQEVWDVHHEGEPMPGEEDEDDDIQVAGGPELAKNNKCPICTKDLLSLLDPLEDQVGIVYCRVCIEHFISVKAKAKQPCTCPQVGTSHEIRKENLKPAKAVIRAQKRAAKKGSSGASGSQRQKKAQVVIDEDDDEEVL